MLHFVPFILLRLSFFPLLYSLISSFLLYFHVFHTDCQLVRMMTFFFALHLSLAWIHHGATKCIFKTTRLQDSHFKTNQQKTSTTTHGANISLIS